MDWKESLNDWWPWRTKVLTPQSQEAAEAAFEAGWHRGRAAIQNEQSLGCAKCGAAVHSDDPQPGDWCLDCNMADTPAINSICDNGSRTRLLEKLQRGNSIKGFSPREEVLLIDAVRRAIAP